MALRINPRLLTGTFDYYEFEENDVWMEPNYADPVVIQNVRLDEEQASNATSLGASEAKIRAVAFVYVSDTTPLVKFKRRSKVVTPNGSYHIHKVVEVNEPFEKKLWSVELELI